MPSLLASFDGAIFCVVFAATIPRFPGRFSAGYERPNQGWQTLTWALCVAGAGVTLSPTTHVPSGTHMFRTPGAWLAKALFPRRE